VNGLIIACLFEGVFFFSHIVFQTRRRASMKTKCILGFVLLASFLMSTGMARADLIFDMGVVAFSPTGDQLGRLSRDGITSDWAEQKAFPGVINTGTQYAYELFDFNSGVYSFIQVSFDDPFVAFFDSAYLKPYTPVSLDINYLGDPGSSGEWFGNPNYFQIQVPQFTDLQIVVNEVSHGGGSGKSFDLLVEGFIDQNYDGAPTVPEPATILLIGAGVAVLGLVRARRNRNQPVSCSK
jgi:hypothetical protein